MSGTHYTGRGDRWAGTEQVKKCPFKIKKIIYLPYRPDNDGKSAASFCCKVAAWFPHMFCNFYLEKNHNIAYNSTTTHDREKKERILILRICEIFLDIFFTKFKNYHIYLNKISHRFLLTTNLFTGWKSLMRYPLLVPKSSRPLVIFADRKHKR